MKRLSARKYAELRGVSHTAVNKAIKQGRIKRGADGLIDPAEADKLWEQNTSPAPRSSGKKGKGGQAPPSVAAEVETKPGNEPTPEEKTYAAARARRELANAIKAEAETDEYLGNLFPLEYMEQQLTAALSAAAATFRATPTRLISALVKAKIIPTTAQRRALRIAEDMIEEAVEELSTAGDRLNVDDDAADAESAA